MSEPGQQAAEQPAANGQEPAENGWEPAEPVAEEPALAGDVEIEDAAGTDAAAGHPAVEAALRAVAEVADAPPADQLPAYQAAHRTLRETLAAIDEQ